LRLLPPRRHGCHAAPGSSGARSCTSCLATHLQASLAASQGECTDKGHYPVLHLVRAPASGSPYPGMISIERGATEAAGALYRRREVQKQPEATSATLSAQAQGGFPLGSVGLSTATSADLLLSSPESCRSRGLVPRKPAGSALERPHPENSTYRFKIIPPPSRETDGICCLTSSNSAGASARTRRCSHLNSRRL